MAQPQPEGSVAVICRILGRYLLQDTRQPVFVGGGSA